MWGVLQLPDRVARMMGVDRVVVGLAELVVMGPGSYLSAEEAESAAGQVRRQTEKEEERRRRSSGVGAGVWPSWW